MESFSIQSSLISTCPIVAARNAITGSYWYENERTISGGAVDDTLNCEMTHGDMCFYMTQRSMEVARLEISKPDMKSCLRHVSKYDYNNKDYKFLYVRILSNLPSKNNTYKALTKTHTLLESLDDYLTLYFAKNPANVSIPQLASIDPAMAMYVPDRLSVDVKSCLKFINNINIKSSAKKKMKPIVFTSRPPVKLDLTTKFPDIFKNIDVLSRDTLLAKIKELLRHEMIVAEYIYQIEQYHAEVINILSKIQCEVKAMFESLV